jgi:hypothetical protein
MSDIMMFHAVPMSNGNLTPEDLVLIAQEDEESLLADAGFYSGCIEAMTKYLESLGLTIVELPPDEEDTDGIYNQKVAIIQHASFEAISSKVEKDAQEEHEEEMEYLIEAIAESIEMATPLECDIAILWC